MLNIVGAGMGNDGIEQNTDDMDGKLTGEMALKYPGVIVGIKSAHFTGPEWKPYEQGVIAGTIAHIPLMIDYGSRRIERPLYELLEEKLRPGDIYTHMYGGGRGEQDCTTGGPGKGMWEGRQRGIYFDVGHGQSSFNYSVAVPLIKAGFVPDSISTDLHYESMNAGMKDLLTTGDKFIAMGLPFKEVIADMTWHPAVEVQQTQLGNLSVGSIADIAVLALRQGTFGLVDGAGMVMKAHEKMECELTVKNGKFVYDLNGRASDPWDQPPSPAARQSNKWTSLRMQRLRRKPASNPADPRRSGRNRSPGPGSRCQRTPASSPLAALRYRRQRKSYGKVERKTHPRRRKNSNPQGAPSGSNAGDTTLSIMASSTATTTVSSKTKAAHRKVRGFLLMIPARVRFRI